MLSVLAYRKGWERKRRWYEERMGIPVVGPGAHPGFKAEPSISPLVIKSRDGDDGSIDQQRIEQLINDAEKTVSEMTGENVNLPDITDRASLESDRNFELRIRDRERKLIKKLQEALQRIEDGTFGVCELCGENISESAQETELLDAHCSIVDALYLPWTQHRDLQPTLWVVRLQVLDAVRVFGSAHCTAWTHSALQARQVSRHP